LLATSDCTIIHQVFGATTSSAADHL